VDLKNFVDHWWKALTVAGVTITAAAIAVKYPPAILLGAGILSLGAGEWIMHPEFTRPIQHGVQTYLVTTQERHAKPAGNVLLVVGALLCFAAVVKLMMA
jgi:hypothetical protein